MPRVDQAGPAGNRPTAPIAAPTGAVPPKPGRADWYSFSRPDHARLAAEDRAFYQAAIRRVREARRAAEAADQAPRNLAVRPQNQFDGDDRNACGTTSLAGILAYWDPGSRLGNHQALDRLMRRGDMFSSPDELLRVARAAGYRADMKTGASLDDIRKMLDQGVPVQVVVDPDSDGGDITLHYVAVTGYKTDSSGKITSLTITDPGGGEVYEEAADHFLKRWSDLRMGGIATGFDRVMLSYVPAGDRPIKGLDGKSRPASEIALAGDGLLGSVFSDSQPIRTAARGMSNAVNGALGGNPVRALAGAFQVVGGIPGLLVGGAGQYLGRGGDAALGWAERQWREGGALGKVGAAFGFAGGGLAQGLGWGLAKAGAAWSYGAGRIGDGIGKVGDGLASLGGSVARGLKDVFGGW
ncbi:MAG: C39 family peptidase [Candidatus Sericytochromatia bacterium]|nr:C39 family peptidase [Candidatus Tanganyikabacteria bacterium]